MSGKISDVKKKIDLDGSRGTPGTSLSGYASCCVEMSEEILRLHQLLMQTNHDISSSLMSLQLQIKSLEFKKSVHKEDLVNIEHLTDGIIEYLQLAKRKYISSSPEEEGQLSSFQESVSLGRLVERIRSVFDLALQEKSIRIQLRGDTEKEIPHYSGSFLVQVLHNLISNAIKFSPKNSDIWISLFDQGEDLILSIQDEGKGIDPKLLESLKTDNAKLANLPSSLGTSGETGNGYGLLSALAYLKNQSNLSWDLRTGSSTSRGKGTEFLIRFSKSDS